jgi:hypothetical protein
MKSLSLPLLLFSHLALSWTLSRLSLAHLERPLTHTHTRAPQGAGGVVRRRSRGSCRLCHSRPPRRKLCLATDKGTTARPLPRYCRRSCTHACPSSRQHAAPTVHSMIKSGTKPSSPHKPCGTPKKSSYVSSDKLPGPRTVE